MYSWAPACALVRGRSFVHIAAGLLMLQIRSAQITGTSPWSLPVFCFAWGLMCCQLSKAAILVGYAKAYVLWTMKGTCS